MADYRLYPLPLQYDRVTVRPSALRDNPKALKAGTALASPPQRRARPSTGTGHPPSSPTPSHHPSPCHPLGKPVGDADTDRVAEYRPRDNVTTALLSLPCPALPYPAPFPHPGLYPSVNACLTSSQYSMSQSVPVLGSVRAAPRTAWPPPYPGIVAPRHAQRSARGKRSPGTPQHLHHPHPPRARRDRPSASALPSPILHRHTLPHAPARTTTPPPHRARASCIECCMVPACVVRAACTGGGLARVGMRCGCYS